MKIERKVRKKNRDKEEKFRERAIKIKRFRSIDVEKYNNLI